MPTFIRVIERTRALIARGYDKNLEIRMEWEPNTIYFQNDLDMFSQKSTTFLLMINEEHYDLLPMTTIELIIKV